MRNEGNTLYRVDWAGGGIRAIKLPAYKDHYADPAFNWFGDESDAD